MTVGAYQNDRWAGLGVKSKTILSTIFVPAVQYGIGSARAPCHVTQGVATPWILGPKGFLDNGVGIF